MYTRHQQEVDKSVADQTDTEKQIFCILLNVTENPGGALQLHVLLENNSAYRFPGGALDGKVLMQGSESGMVTRPDLNNYWRYKVKIVILTNLAISKTIQARYGEIVDSYALGGKDFKNAKPDRTDTTLSKVIAVFRKPRSGEEIIRIKDAVLVQGMVDQRNRRIRVLRLNAPMSYPDPKSPEAKLYKYEVGFLPLQALQRDVESIRHGLGVLGLSGLVEEVKDQSKFYQRFPGGEISGNAVSVKDRKGGIIVKQSTKSMTSLWHSADFRNASWDRIQAKGQKFSPLLKRAPSTLLQPIKTWISSISDIEKLAVSSLMVIYSIISLGSFDASSTGAGAKQPNKPPSDV